MEFGNRQERLFTQKSEQVSRANAQVQDRRAALDASLFATKDAVDRQTQQIEDKLKKLDEGLSDAKGAAVDTRDLVNTTRQEVYQVRNKVLEPLAVFVGLFTFASIGFQIFAQVREYILWMPILLAVIGAIIIFAGLIIHASSMAGDVRGRRWWTGIITLAGFIIITLAGFVYWLATDTLRAEDAKYCVRVVSESDENSYDRYCKLKR